ncbi:alanine racemase [Arsenicicoccus sp. oral taxon 190]|uniref:alanine racemase n=1 Tax=Arsenicicoccus sp. oral taxon 190 TaxID=1658671 RepID=UPI00067A3C94|nr:alanine racemase [Arsenicicoccus sp. oral taxon 190]AKT51237.1 alanine racemase [Arsenicicoccus sp. oral taxon 190]
MTAVRDDRAERLRELLAGRDAPFAVVDLDRWDANSRALLERAGGLPVRLASKSVRCRALVHRALEHGFQGVLAYSLDEALWLAEDGVPDVLLAYPPVGREALTRLARHPQRDRVTVMTDHPDHVRLLTETTREAGGGPVRVCLDLDASLRVGPLHLGVRRSCLRTPAQGAAAARAIQALPELRLVGVMAYDAQVAGLQDTSPAVRAVKAASVRELNRRRAAVVRAVEDVLGHPLELVNGGGTGSLHLFGADPATTELAAGSGLMSPRLFDGYRDFRHAPAAWFVLPVVRRPAPRVATCYSGGYAASGAAGRDRLPTPVAPYGLSLLGTEGAGEVQTPVTGPAAERLRVGDHVWWRHAKAGEMCERFDRLLLVAGEEVVGEVPTYRGEGKAFG